MCRLHKSIYGLKQALRAWLLRLSQALLALGFSGSNVDTPLFTFHHNNISVFVLIYVDNITVASNSLTSIDHLSLILELTLLSKPLVLYLIFWAFKLNIYKKGSILVMTNMQLTSCIAQKWLEQNQLLALTLQELNSQNFKGIHSLILLNT